MCSKIAGGKAIYPFRRVQPEVITKFLSWFCNTHHGCANISKPCPETGGESRA